MKRNAFVISVIFTRKNDKDLCVFNCLDVESLFPLTIFCPLSSASKKCPNLVNHCLGDSHSPDNFGRYVLGLADSVGCFVDFDFVVPYHFVKCGDDVFRPVLI